MIVEKWKLKAVVQKGISFMPKPSKVNYMFQKYVTKGVNLNDEHFGYKIQHAKDHIEFFSKYGVLDPSKTILELGTGWYPIIPLFMYLTNSGKVISLDIQSWMTKESQIVAINKIKEWKLSGELNNYFENIDEIKWAKLINVSENNDNYTKEDINNLIGLTPIIKDARSTGLKDNSIDFICSNNTFEHVFKNVLEGILKEFNRIVKNDGVMSHFIDMTDHFAHFDKSITIYNFLKYSNKRWDLIDNTIQPQNRMRFPTYKEMYAKLTIPITEEVIREGCQKQLDTVEVHHEFNKFSNVELAISHGYIISKMNKK